MSTHTATRIEVTFEPNRALAEQLAIHDDSPPTTAHTRLRQGKLAHRHDTRDTDQCVC